MTLNDRWRSRGPAWRMLSWSDYSYSAGRVFKRFRLRAWLAIAVVFTGLGVLVGTTHGAVRVVGIVSLTIAMAALRVATL